MAHSRSKEKGENVRRCDSDVVKCAPLGLWRQWTCGAPTGGFSEIERRSMVGAQGVGAGRATRAPSVKPLAGITGSSQCLPAPGRRAGDSFRCANGVGRPIVTVRHAALGGAWSVARLQPPFVAALVGDRPHWPRVNVVNDTWPRAPLRIGAVKFRGLRKEESMVNQVC